jgi:DDE superfamily endonuclease
VFHTTATQLCVGFIYGTLIETARPPGLILRATYSGHKTRPGLKWQAVTTPDGLLFHVCGPFEGRGHDMVLYEQSGIDDVLGYLLLVDRIRHYLYGDSGYIKKYFAHVGIPRKVFLSRTPAGAWYLGSCLLWNFRCCLEGSPTSTYFNSVLVSTRMKFNHHACFTIEGD